MSVQGSTLFLLNVMTVPMCARRATSTVFIVMAITPQMHAVGPMRSKLTILTQNVRTCRGRRNCRNMNGERRYSTE
ncbi:hypothetical protein KCP69_24925 [Salmonella enterica subsp. enterica]|nr:hypothetical protein KCP69_24925 [Salmonella enterica subsp. enterica]